MATRLLVALFLISTTASNSNCRRGAPGLQDELETSPHTARSLRAPTDDSDQRWAQADPERRLHFPHDHGAHPEYKTEWWYYSGNLTNSGGSRYGYQLTFFRVGVRPETQNPSAWAIRHLLVAHFALTDVSEKAFHHAERLDRPGIGWSGAQEGNLHIWVEEWSARLDQGRHRLFAATEGYEIDLELTSTRAPLLHGGNGYSRKSADGDSASHYYSLTRLKTQGTIVVAGRREEVTGHSWMDHEFGSTFLTAEDRGWDWISLQLDDGTDLMLFRIHGGTAESSRFASGTVRTRDGTVTKISAADFTLKPREQWRSPHTQTYYPVVWRIAIPSEAITLNVEAAVEHQELRAFDTVGFAYWEGCIRASGKRNGASVRGQGYLEMTGYGETSMSRVFR